jgi:hypothetical protein
MNTAQRTVQKILLAALVASPVIAAAPALAAPPIPVVRLEPMVIVGHRRVSQPTNELASARLPVATAHRIAL